MYTWKQTDWPAFTYNLQAIEKVSKQFAQETERVSELLHKLPKGVAQEAVTQMLIAEAIKTSAIEGEFFSRQDIMSSIKNRLGLNLIPENIKDKRAQGAGELVVDVRQSFATIEKNKKEYYAAFATAQKSNEITGWITYFSETVLQAQREAK